jgi:hypothetical protein
LAFGALLLWTACLAAQGGTPLMTVSYSKLVSSDQDVNRPGIQHKILYGIENVSTNSFYMINFTVPAGTNQGVYKVVKGLDSFRYWTVQTKANSVFLDGTGHVLAPNAPQGTVTLFFDATATGLAYANAKAYDETGNLPFNAVLVEVPVVAPGLPGLSGLTVSSNGVSVTGTNLAWGYSYTLERSADLVGWSNAVSFWATNFAGPTGAETLTLPSAPNAPAEFLRLRWP